MLDLKHDILDYLVRAPAAGDTVEGIAGWWLLEQRIRNAMADVQRALEELVDEGWVRKQRQSDGRFHYRVREDRLADIRRLLSHAPKEVRPAASNVSGE